MLKHILRMHIYKVLNMHKCSQAMFQLILNKAVIIPIIFKCQELIIRQINKIYI
jgi:hypothetical protein